MDSRPTLSKLALFFVVIAIPLAGCLQGGQSGRTARDGCLAIAEPSPPAGGRAAVVALLGAADPENGRFGGNGERLIRVSLPGGAIEAERVLKRGTGQRRIDRADELRLDARSGPLLATARGRKTVLALIRATAAGRDQVALVNAQDLRLRCSRPLAPGVNYGGLLLGRSRVYAYGVKRVETGVWDAVVTVIAVRSGRLLGTHTVREAERASGGRDWFVYWGALSQDERRLILSYHGSDTTGADWFRVSPNGTVSRGGLADRRCAERRRGRRCGSGRTDIGSAHGAVAGSQSGFVAATGTDQLLELDRNGRVTRRLPVRASKTHLMDLALDPGRRLAYVSSCGRHPAIQRLDLAHGSRKIVPSGRACGKPLAVHSDRYLVLDAVGVGKLGYPRTTGGALRLLDLRRPGRGRVISLPGSARVLDAVVVQR